MERRLSLLPCLVRLLTIAALLAGAPHPSAGAGRDPIYVGLATSFSGDYTSSGAVPAVHLALEMVDESNILPAHNLTLLGDIGDSKCEQRPALEAFFDVIDVGPPVFAYFGSGCSIATEPLAQITDFFNLIHFSYAAAAASLDDRSRFPNFWRTYPSEDNLADALVAIVREYGWRQLRIITQQESLFTATLATLQTVLMDNNVTIEENGTTLFSSTQNIFENENIFQPEIRVHLLNTYDVHARRVLCAAATRSPTSELYYPGYIWITLGWYREGWWREDVANDNTTVGCTDALLEPFLRRSLAIRELPATDNRSALTNVFLTADGFDAEYKRRVAMTNGTLESTAPLAYDAVWALALAIKRSLPVLAAENVSFSDLTNKRPANGTRGVTQIVMETLERTDFSFVGVSGLVQFNVNGTRIKSIPRVQQYRDSSSTDIPCNNSDPSGGSLTLDSIAIIDEGDEFQYWLCYNTTNIWPLDEIPSDGTPTDQIRTVSFVLFVTYSILASLGILFAIFCLIFNIVFRNRKIVKLISPNLNYVLIAGAIMLNSSTYFYVLPSTDRLAQDYACIIRSWFQPLGYFLCFSVIMVKMWRVYYIFHNPSIKKKRKTPKDWQLLIAVAVICSVVVIVMTFVTAIGNYHAVLIRDQELDFTRNSRDQTIILYYVYSCQGPLDRIWLYFLFGIILVAQLLAVYFAVRTRKVHIRALNDSKYMAVITYITTMIIIVMLVGVVALDKFINFDAAVFAGGLMIFTTVVLTLTFIPKMVILYKDPQGEKIFSRTYSQAHITVGTVTDEHFVELEKHCRQLESKLGKYEKVKPFRALKYRAGSKSRLDSTSDPKASALTTSYISPLHSLSISKGPLLQATLDRTGTTNVDLELGVAVTGSEPSSNTTTSHSLENGGTEVSPSHTLGSSPGSEKEELNNRPVDIGTDM